jgi:cytochrome c-type biogenesis protein
VTSIDVSLVAAFAGGVASFSSPCVLPLVPAYLSIVGGLDLARVESSVDADGIAIRPTARRRGNAGSRRLGAVTRDTSLFVAGFSSVFTLLGLSANALGRAIVHDQAVLTKVSGVLIVAMALFLFATLVLRTPGLYREWRPHPRLARLGPLAAPVAGAAFAFGWTPCVGPVLASVLALSAEQGHAGAGALLLATYSLGLGTPFLLVGVFFDRVSWPLEWLRRHGSTVTALSASALGVLGVLLILDRLAWITTLFQKLGS